MASRLQTEAQINMKAWEDPAFRELLTKNPQEALKNLGMKNVPSNLKVQVVAEESNEWVIRLYNRPINYQELSEQDLEVVACGEPQRANCCPKPS